MASTGARFATLFLVHFSPRIDGPFAGDHSGVFHFEELRTEETSEEVCGLILISQMSENVTAHSELRTAFPAMKGTHSFDYIILVLNPEVVFHEILSSEHCATTVTG